MKTFDDVLFTKNVKSQKPNGGAKLIAKHLYYFSFLFFSLMLFNPDSLRAQDLCGTPISLYNKNQLI